MPIDKRHILEEIKRTTTANGGVPLGQQKFSRETGIKKGDWAGVYWARWGDALREAGYAPNQFQAAFQEDFLLERYATLVRELGHLPTSYEVKLKRQTHPDFPHQSTFETRFRPKRQLLTRLVAFCRQHGGFDDVVQICEAQPTPSLRQQPDRAHPAPETFGVVYLIQSGRFYKIGKTNALGRRQYELAIQLPEKARTVHSIRTDDPTGIEAYWHKRFEERRKNGEWFQLTPADISAFKRRKFM
jgi:hypothetical protein